LIFKKKLLELCKNCARNITPWPTHNLYKLVGSTHIPSFFSFSFSLFYFILFFGHASIWYGTFIYVELVYRVCCGLMLHVTIFVKNYNNKCMEEQFDNNIYLIFLHFPILFFFFFFFFGSWILFFIGFLDFSFLSLSSQFGQFATGVYKDFKYKILNSFLK
jgi:hypothetical protein